MVAGSIVPGAAVGGATVGLSGVDFMDLAFLVHPETQDGHLGLPHRKCFNRSGELLALSYVSSGLAVFAAATVFALGVCYFWPTMLGVVSERVPKSGALGLGLMGTVGMATVGLVAAPQMGRIADQYAHGEIAVAEVVTVFERTSMVLGNDSDPDAQAAVAATQEVTMSYETTGVLPSPATSNALRAIISSDADETLVGQAQAILGPADNYGGRISFRYVVPLCGALLLIFSGLYARDRQAGGYRVESLEGSA